MPNYTRYSGEPKQENLNVRLRNASQIIDVAKRPFRALSFNNKVTTALTVKCGYTINHFQPLKTQQALVQNFFALRKE